MSGIAETIDIDCVKRHYYSCHNCINLTQSEPKGPSLNFASAYDCVTKFA